MTSDQLPLIRLGSVTLNSADLDRLTVFYREILRMIVVRNADDRRILRLDNEDFTLRINKVDGAALPDRLSLTKAARLASINFCVGTSPVELEAWQTWLAQHQISFTDSPMDKISRDGGIVQAIEFVDPDRNNICLYVLLEPGPWQEQHDEDESPERTLDAFARVKKGDDIHDAFDVNIGIEL